MRELPRFTRILRIISDLDREIDQSRGNDLNVKRQEAAERLKRNLDWHGICKNLPDDVVPLLNKIHRIVSNICEKQPIEMTNELSLYLLRLLIVERVVSQETSSEIIQLLGITDPKVLKDLSMIGREIRQHISEDEYNLIICKDDELFNDLKPEMFGSNIPYRHFERKVEWPTIDNLHDMTGTNIESKTNKLCQLLKMPEVRVVAAKKTNFYLVRLNNGINRAFKKYCAVMSYDKFVTCLIDKLKTPSQSPPGSTQSELFDWLGDENFEFIEYIIEHKRDVLAWHRRGELYKKYNESQVIVNSEKEKQQEKQVLCVEAEPLLTKDEISTPPAVPEECPFVSDSKITTTTSTDLERIASHYCLKYDTIEIFNELIEPLMHEAKILNLVSQSQEFEQLKVRDNEMKELRHLKNNYCKFNPEGGKDNIHGKINVLIQAYLSRAHINSSSILSDQSYIIQNAVRIFRALFEMMLRRKNAIMAGRVLGMAKMMEHQQWDTKSALRQFPCLPFEVIKKIEKKELSIKNLRDIGVNNIGIMIRNLEMAHLVKKCCNELPIVNFGVVLQPITRTILRVCLRIIPAFNWNDEVHDKAEAFWLWIEDQENNFIYHYEYIQFTKKQVLAGAEQELVMNIPLVDPLPNEYIVKAISNHWLGSEYAQPLKILGLILPESYPPYTDFLPSHLVPVSALESPEFQRLYKFTHFNTIQSQVFHCLYRTNQNVLLGAPTGSGKTTAAEIAMMRVLSRNRERKVVYVAPLKALVAERMKDWTERFGEQLGINVVELTGDTEIDFKLISTSNIIVTTPEKWDRISRLWSKRDYAQSVALIIIDEIHLLGEDRGPLLEVIVSRSKVNARHTRDMLRIIGLSTTLANAVDVGHWLGIQTVGLYNFHPMVRPVPLEIEVAGFSGRNYCPRMATMNKPIFAAIQQYAPQRPTLIFVSSRHQALLTARDLITYLVAEDNPKQWLHMSQVLMDNILESIKEEKLKVTLTFGIGFHHATLEEKDRQTVEELFVNNKIQVLVTTAPLAWSVNFSASLVVIKGTEYYDAKSKRYVDMPITDLLQMMGRAGRTQFDVSGVALVLVHDVKKAFYKHFLHEPFPVESNLLKVLPDYINAEVVAGTIATKEHVLEYLKWTYFYRRLTSNPSYYDLESKEPDAVDAYLSKLVDDVLKILVDNQCLSVHTIETEQIIRSHLLGQTAAYSCLSYRTVSMYNKELVDNLSIETCLKILCNSHEYGELPVRHNEDLINEKLAESCRYPLENLSYDSPNSKAFLLLQAHFSRLPLPWAEYRTDLISVLDQSVRMLEAMINVAEDRGFLSAILRIIQLLQMVYQARWIDEPAVLTLPYIEKDHLQLFTCFPNSLPHFCATVAKNYESLSLFLQGFTSDQVIKIYEVAKKLPVLTVKLSILGDLDYSDYEERPIDLTPNGNINCLNLHGYRHYKLIIRMTRSGCLSAHCPRFHRPKGEAWFLILGDSKLRKILSMIRVSDVSVYKELSLMFFLPKQRGPKRLDFYLMSDCYIGLDQQYSIFINVI